MSVRVKELLLTNFRNYHRASWQFGEQTAIVGVNTSGKTNILEAIYLLASTKSFRADRELEMIRWGETTAVVKARLQTADGDHELVVGLTAGERLTQKSFVLDKQKWRARELIGRFPMVLFTAEDTRLIDGSPGRRRHALDLLLSQSSPCYLEAYRRYAKVLASRNRLLEQIQSGEATTAELDFWDAELIASGQIIITERQRLVAYGTKTLPGLYAAFISQTDPQSPSAGKLTVAYRPLSAALAKDVPSRRQQDIAIGTTTVGPHRDDWTLLLGNRTLSSFGSGGEYRSAILAWKLAEVGWLTSELDRTPLLLLDDVFSELDNWRRDALLASLPATQLFITTPELTGLPDRLTGGLTVIKLPAPKLAGAHQ